MERYFFDVVGHGRSELDCTHRILPTPERAYDAAELMAFDIVVTREDEAIGWAVNMSGAEGCKPFVDPSASVLSVCRVGTAALLEATAPTAMVPRRVHRPPPLISTANSCGFGCRRGRRTSSASCFQAPSDVAER